MLLGTNVGKTILNIMLMHFKFVEGKIKTLHVYLDSIVGSAKKLVAYYKKSNREPDRYIKELHIKTLGLTIPKDILPQLTAIRSLPGINKSARKYPLKI